MSEPAKGVSLPEIKDSTGSELQKSEPRARVVLPTPADVESDEEGAEDVEGGDTNDGDLLMNLPDDTEEIELLHSRIGSLAPLRLERFAAHLKRLCLRQNSISHLDPGLFEKLVNLEELDFYDNKLKTLEEVLENLTNLKVLDLSFNLLRAVPDRLGQLTSLDTIYFVQNKIKEITGFTSCITLRSLELGGNRIRRIEGLESLSNLEELWLGKNKISKLEGLGGLKKLRILSIQSNRITQLEGLDDLEELEQLYISHNGVKKLEGLDKNTKLTTLDVGSNFIPLIESISHLQLLEELWMNNNQVPDLHALDTELKDLPKLQTLYLEGNPCQTNDMTGYRRKIMLALPKLAQIDALYTRGGLV